MKRLLLAQIVASLYSTAIFAAAPANFSTLELTLPHVISQPPLLADVAPNEGKELILVGSGLDNAHQISVVGIDNGALKVLDSFAIGKEYLAIDSLPEAKTGEASLFFLAAGHVARYEFPKNDKPERLQLYQNTDSIYRTKHSNYLARIDFIDDINGDGVADVLLPSFDHYFVWMSKKNTELKRYKLAIPSLISVVRRDVEIQRPAISIMDGDTPQIFHANKGQITQFKFGPNSPSDVQIKLRDEIYGIEWWDLLDESGQSPDQSNLSHRVVERVTDVNGDDIPDLVVRFTSSSGALDRRNDYEMYYGAIEQGVLAFPSAPSAVIGASGTLTGLLLEDIDGDKKLDVLVSSFEIGVSQIVSALLSGSIDQDVLIYRQSAEGQFGKTPSDSFETQMHFSLSKGRAGEPLVTLADVNGDGLDDLLLTANDSEVRIRYGEPNKKFSRMERVKTAVPQSGDNIQLFDINNDGKADLVMSFDKLDADEKRKTLKVLLAK